MTPRYSSTLPDIFRNLRGCRIRRVRRLLREPQHSDLPTDVANEEADGITELEFDQGQLLHFVPDTETMSVLVAVGAITVPPDPSGTLMDVSTNSFWKPRTRAAVSRILLWTPSNLSSPSDEDPCEFALEFELSDGQRFAIEYVSDDVHPDSLIISPSVRQESAEPTPLT